MLSNVAYGIVAGLIIVSLIVAFCFALIRLHFTKIKNYTRLLYQKDLDFQKTLNSTIIETQEQVLNNISQDLHDDAGQQLTYINFQIENLKLDSPELGQLLAPLSDSVTQLSRSIRRISHSLNNQLLTQQDLLKAITAEAERWEQNGKFAIQLDIEDSQLPELEINEQIVIYRIFQEILNNILKHSNASTINIRIVTQPQFVMEIRDNGKGFDTKNHKTTLGLHNMSHRASAINYSAVINSVPGIGTSVTVLPNKI